MRGLAEVGARASRYEPVTMEEAVALVRSITRTCRGCAVLPLADMRRLHAAYDTRAERADWDGAYRVCQEAEHIVGITGPYVAKGQWDELARRAYNAIFAHGDTVGKPCGEDFNDQICAHPFDGKQRQGKCPKCGAEHVFTSPVFVLEESAAA